MSIINDKIIAQWEHHIYMQSLSMKDSTRIELFYFDDNFCCIARWVSTFMIGSSHHVHFIRLGRQKVKKSKSLSTIDYFISDSKPL